MSSPAQKPCLAAAAFFAALGALIARLAVAPLGAADLLGISACAAAAGAFATLAFTLRAPERIAQPQAATTAMLPAAELEKLTATLESRLAAQVSAALSAGFAAADEKRQAEVQAAVTATTPPRELDTDKLPTPAAGAKPRLGRGLLGLMQSPSALASVARPTPPTVSAAEDEDERAAA